MSVHVLLNLLSQLGKRDEEHFIGGGGGSRGQPTVPTPMLYYY